MSSTPLTPINLDVVIAGVSDAHIDDLLRPYGHPNTTASMTIRRVRTFAEAQTLVLSGVSPLLPWCYVPADATPQNNYGSILRMLTSYFGQPQTPSSVVKMQNNEKAVRPRRP